MPIPVFMYHHVTPHQGDMVSVTPQVFKEQMLKTFLGRRSPAEALAAAAGTWTKILREQGK